MWFRRRPFLESHGLQSHRVVAGDLRGEPRKLVQYWRDCLLDGQRREIPIRDSRAFGVTASFEEVQKGLCARSQVEELRRRSNTDDRPKPAADTRFESDVEGPLEVLICPLRYARTRRHGSGPVFAELLWIPAELSSSGTLLPPRRATPWIPRAYLEPLEGDFTLSIATVESVNAFMYRRAPEEFQSWLDYWDFCNQFFAHATGMTIARYRLEDYERRAEVLLVSGSTSFNSTAQLLRLYDEVLSGVQCSGLLPAVGHTAMAARQSFPRSKGKIRIAAIKHCGQFSDSFTLAPSQREVLHRTFTVPQGELMSITGPPGTGKTTLLQSIVASLWVDAARRKAAAPPIIVACGATNQSVRNILDSFARAQSDSPLADRWLPGVTSYGLFCCSERKKEEMLAYQLELRDGSGLAGSMEQWEYIARAERYFLQRVYALTHKKVGVAEAAVLLHREIRKQFARLSGGVFRAKDGSLLEWLQSSLGLRPKISREEFFESLNAFDTGCRNLAFLLATHYWEARWLQAVRTELEDRERLGQRRRRPELGLKDLERRAMISPLFVSTVSSFPAFFNLRSKSGAPPVDLLIFDEAGQIAVEQGGICLALAKKALVVGDRLQLEPYFGIEPHIDLANRVKNGLCDREDRRKDVLFARRGLLPSKNSLMEFAAGATRWQDDRKVGGFLSEQRRCLPKIVEFLNTLAYRNRLIAKREPDPGLPLRPFNYAHVPGEAEHIGSSWRNGEEVAQIAAWLSQHAAMLERSYGKKLPEIVAVITPFAKQAERLQTVLRKQWPDMTTGTVNRLQGAEFPVVLFSSVYDRLYDKRYHFDRDVRLLNVAASRAKDSFLVFGDMAIFNPSLDSPSGILARYLFEDEENEIPLELSLRKGYRAEDVLRLTTLEEHQEILEEALTGGEEEVIIVSPTISEHALRKDKLPEMIAAAVARGLRVIVYTDSYIDVQEGVLRPAAAAGHALLRQAGAELHIAQGIHNKALSIDNHTLAEGSFNWLSAVRNRHSVYQKIEVSTLYRGPRVHREIASLKELMDFRCGIRPKASSSKLAPRRTKASIKSLANS